MLTHISVRGAREHNLKGVDVEIPRESLTVITGLSGSGKSSLAFDTIYAEGQRRYVESLPAFTRVRIDGVFYAIEDAPALDKKYKHDIEVVVDRIVVREGIEPRLADSFEQALKLAEGLAYRDPADAPAEPEQQSGMKLDYAPPGRILF